MPNTFVVWLTGVLAGAFLGVVLASAFLQARCG